MLRLALTAPRFDTADVEINRAQILSSLRRGRRPARPISPAGAGGKPPSPAILMAGRSSGTLEIGADHHHRRSARLCASGAGARQPQDRHRRRHRRRDGEALLDRVFGALPAKADVDAGRQRHRRRALGRRIVIDLDVPQAVVDFGGPGIARKDPDFMAAYVVNHILGGGSFVLAALPGSARKARPGLFGLRQPDLARSYRGVFRRHRHPCRPRRRDGRSDQKEIQRSPRTARRRTNSPRPKNISTARSCSISTRRARSRHYWCSCSSTISASIMSTQRPRDDRCGDARRRQAGRQAPARRRHAGHRSRHARRASPRATGAGPGRLKPASGG